MRDRRGMGRVVRATLRAARGDSRFVVTALADRAADVRALGEEFPGLAVAPSRSARRPDAYDVVWFPFNGMRFSVAARAVVSIYDAFAFTEPHRDRVARFREQAPIRRAAREATRFTTISDWSRAEIARALGIAAHRIDVVPPAPDPFWFAGPADALPARLEHARFALLVGAREPRKNARVAIDACSRAFGDRNEWLVVVGALRDADRAYARACGVRCGEIAASDAMLRALYRGAAVVLVPSLAEGFGLVAAEALACGAPVLAANAAALPEATGSAATLLDPHDVPAWARAIRTVFDDPATAAAMRQRALARFASVDRDAPARRVLALLERVALGPRA